MLGPGNDATSPQFDRGAVVLQLQNRLVASRDLLLSDAGATIDVDAELDALQAVQAIVDE